MISTLVQTPISHPIQKIVQVPGSKSITNRALVLAALQSSGGGTTLHHVLQSEDTEVMVHALKTLGFDLEVDWSAKRIRVNRQHTGRIIPVEQADLFVGNSGTSVRFLTAMLALGGGKYRLDGIPRMRERPIQDLLDALQELGLEADSEQGTGCPPVTILARPWQSHRVTIRAHLSSQFLSALMLAIPFAAHRTEIFVQGETVSEPYIEMTYRMVKDWGLSLDRTESGYLSQGISQRTHFLENYSIEPDASSASYFFAAAALTGGEITVQGLTRHSLQGDVAFLDALARMGATTDETPLGLRVRGGGVLRGIDIDMNAISDTTMTLAVLALFAQGTTRIRNVAHIRHKETDRISALATELRKCGAEVEEFPDGLQITPGPLREASIATYNDHRMAMSFALVGLKQPRIEIQNPSCVAKTYPNFWEDWEELKKK